MRAGTTFIRGQRRAARVSIHSSRREPRGVPKVDGLLVDSHSSVAMRSRPREEGRNEGRQGETTRASRRGSGEARLAGKCIRSNRPRWTTLAPAAWLAQQVDEGRGRRAAAGHHRNRLQTPPASAAEAGRLACSGARDWMRAVWLAAYEVERRPSILMCP